LRLVTFNIRNGAAADGAFAWPARRVRFLEFLVGLDADVLCLQEVLDFQLDEISAALTGHSYVGVGRDDGMRAGEFVPIFYPQVLELRDSGTIWLSESPEQPGSIDWGGRLPRICTWAEFSGFSIGNVHLDHESKLARTRSAELLLATRPADVLCGDFNAEPGEPCITAMLESGYEDAAVNGGGTFNDFQPEKQLAPRIDYIFVKPSWPTNAHINRRSLVSDHWPVVADIELTT